MDFVKCCLQSVPFFPFSPWHFFIFFLVVPGYFMKVFHILTKSSISGHNDEGVSTSFSEFLRILMTCSIFNIGVPSRCSIFLLGVPGLGVPGILMKVFPFFLGVPGYFDEGVPPSCLRRNG